MANQTIDFKNPIRIIAWLDTALEKEKHKKCPVMRDLVSDHEAAQAWGYVVAGYYTRRGVVQGASAPTW